MVKLNATAVPVIVADTRAAVEATDQALRAGAQMLLSVIDGASGSEVPMHVSQDVYASIVASNGNLIENRANLRRSITILTALKNRSDQREVATGCPGGVPEEAQPHGSIAGAIA